MTGVTLSSEQLAIARQRSAAAGLANAARFELTDYRDVTGRYDRIVSVGMFEHVGINHYQAFFEKVRSLLPDNGVSLIHSIGRSDGPGYTNPFIANISSPAAIFRPCRKFCQPSSVRA